MKSLIVDLRKIKPKPKTTFFLKKHCFKKKIRKTTFLKIFFINRKTYFNNISIFFCITTLLTKNFFLQSIWLNYLFLLPISFNNSILEYVGVVVYKTIKLFNNFLLFVLQNLQKQLYCAMHSLTTLLQKNCSTGVFLKIHNKHLKLLKRKERTQLLFIKFFIKYFKIASFKKKIVLVLKKYNKKMNSKLTFIFFLLKNKIKFVIILPKIKFGMTKFKRIKSIKKTLRKLLLKKI